MAPKPATGKGKASSRDQRRSTSRPATTAPPASGPPSAAATSTEVPDVRTHSSAQAGKTELHTNDNLNQSPMDLSPRQGPLARPSTGKTRTNQTASRPPTFSPKSPKSNTYTGEDNVNIPDTPLSTSSQRCYGQGDLSRSLSPLPSEEEELRGHDQNLHFDLTLQAEESAFWEKFLDDARNVDTVFPDLPDEGIFSAPGQGLSSEKSLELPKIPLLQVASQPKNQDLVLSPAPFLEGFAKGHMKLTASVDLGSLSQDTKSKLSRFPEGNSAKDDRQVDPEPQIHDQRDRDDSAPFSFPVFSATPGYHPTPPQDAQTESPTHSGPYGSQGQIDLIECSSSEEQVGCSSKKKRKTLGVPSKKTSAPKLSITKPRKSVSRQGQVGRKSRTRQGSPDRDSLDDFKIPKTTGSKLEARQAKVLQNFYTPKISYKKSKKSKKPARLSVQRQRKRILTGSNRIPIKYNPVAKVCKNKNEHLLRRNSTPPSPQTNRPLKTVHAHFPGETVSFTLRQKISELENRGSSDSDSDFDPDLDLPPPEFYEALEREKESLGLETRKFSTSGTFYTNGNGESEGEMEYERGRALARAVEESHKRLEQSRQELPSQPVQAATNTTTSAPSLSNSHRPPRSSDSESNFTGFMPVPRTATKYIPPKAFVAQNSNKPPAPRTAKPGSKFKFYPPFSNFPEGGAVATQPGDTTPTERPGRPRVRTLARGGTSPSPAARTSSGSSMERPPRESALQRRRPQSKPSPKSPFKMPITVKVDDVRERQRQGQAQEGDEEAARNPDRGQTPPQGGDQEVDGNGDSNSPKPVAAVPGRQKFIFGAGGILDIAPDSWNWEEENARYHVSRQGRVLEEDLRQTDYMNNTNGHLQLGSPLAGDRPSNPRQGTSSPRPVYSYRPRIIRNFDFRDPTNTDAISGFLTCDFFGVPISSPPSGSPTPLGSPLRFSTSPIRFPNQPDQADENGPRIIRNFEIISGRMTERDREYMRQYRHRTRTSIPDTTTAVPETAPPLEDSPSQLNYEPNSDDEVVEVNPVFAEEEEEAPGDVTMTNDNQQQSSQSLIRDSQPEDPLLTAISQHRAEEETEEWARKISPASQEVQELLSPDGDDGATTSTTSRSSDKRPRMPSPIPQVGPVILIDSPISRRQAIEDAGRVMRELNTSVTTNSDLVIINDATSTTTSATSVDTKKSGDKPATEPATGMTAAAIPANPIAAPPSSLVGLLQTQQSQLKAAAAKKPTPTGAGPTRSAAAEAAAKAALTRASAAALSTAAPPYSAAPQVGERSGGGVSATRTPAQERLHQQRMDLIRSRQGAAGSWAEEMGDQAATDDLILHASRADDPNTPADQDPTQQPPPPRYLDMELRHQPATAPEPMEVVEEARANDSDSASQDSDSRAARQKEVAAASATAGAPSDRRKTTRARITAPEGSQRPSFPSGLRQERREDVDLNATSEHPYPPVEPPTFNPLRYGLNPEADTPEARALLRSAQDKAKDGHLKLIGAALFGTDDVTRPTARLETFFRITGMPADTPMVTIIGHIMNRPVGWLRFYEAYRERDWSVAPAKEYYKMRDKLFDLACQVSKTKKRQRHEGLLNGSGHRTARGQFWSDSIRAGHIPSMQELDAASASAAEQARLHRPLPSASNSRSKSKTRQGRDRSGSPAARAANRQSGPRSSTPTPGSSRLANRLHFSDPGQGSTTAANPDKGSAAAKNPAKGAAAAKNRRPPPSATVTSGALEVMEREEREAAAPRAGRTPVTARLSDQPPDNSGIISINSPRLSRDLNNLSLATHDIVHKTTEPVPDPDRDLSQISNPPSILSTEEGSEVLSLESTKGNFIPKTSDRVCFGPSQSVFINANSPPISTGLRMDGSRTGTIPKRTTSSQSGAGGGGAISRSSSSSTTVNPPSSRNSSTTTNLPVSSQSSRSSNPATRPTPSSSPSASANSTMVASVGSNRSTDAGDHTGDEEEGHRVVIMMANGAPMTKQMEEEVKKALEEEMRSLMVRERTNRNLVRMRVEAWTTRRGGYVLTPGGANPTLNGNRIIQLAQRIRVNGQRVIARWNYDLPQHATLMARFHGSGDARELIEDAFLGLIATNEWPDDLQGQVRFVKVQHEENPSSGHRLIRFEASAEVVRRIQQANGTIYLGFGKATVECNKIPVKEGSKVVYRLQK